MKEFLIACLGVFIFSAPTHGAHWSIWVMQGVASGLIIRYAIELAREDGAK